MSVKDHDLNCDWQLDQYDFECTCGATRPRHPDFVPHLLGTTYTSIIKDEIEEYEDIWRALKEVVEGASPAGYGE